MQLGFLGIDSERCPDCDTNFTGRTCPNCGWPDKPEGEGVTFDAVRWLKCNPRSVHELVRKFGRDWRSELPEGVHWGVQFNTRCYYWIPPERASRTFERKLGSLDLEIKGPLLS